MSDEIATKMVHVERDDGKRAQNGPNDGWRKNVKETKRKDRLMMTEILEVAQR